MGPGKIIWLCCIWLCLSTSAFCKKKKESGTDAAIRAFDRLSKKKAGKPIGTPPAMQRPDSVEAGILKRQEVKPFVKPPSSDCLRTFVGPGDWLKNCINSTCFSPDGRFIASGADDTTVKLWDVSSGKCLRTFKGHTGTINSVSFSPDGSHIISGSLDNTIKLWEVSSGSCIHTFSGHTYSVKSVRFSLDGRYIVSGSWDNTIKLWDVNSGDCLRTFTGHSNLVHSVDLSPDGRYIVSGAGCVACFNDHPPKPSDYTVKLWDVESGTCLRTFTGHNSYVRSVSFSPDGRTIVSGDCWDAIKLWDVSSGLCLRTFTQGKHECFSSIYFSPNGRYIASVSVNEHVKLWDVSSGKCLRTFKGNSYFVRSLSFSPDGRYIVSSSDNDIKLWSVAKYTK